MLDRYSSEHLKEQFVKFGYSDIMTYYEFIDRVKSGQLAIEEENTHKTLPEPK